MGTSDDAPDNDWIDAAEKALLVRLPADYKWFLNHYVGGDICGGRNIQYLLPSV